MLSDRSRSQHTKGSLWRERTWSRSTYRGATSRAHSTCDLEHVHSPSVWVLGTLDLFIGTGICFWPLIIDGKIVRILLLLLIYLCTRIDEEWRRNEKVLIGKINMIFSPISSVFKLLFIKTFILLYDIVW